MNVRSERMIVPASPRLWVDVCLNTRRPLVAYSVGSYESVVVAFDDRMIMPSRLMELDTPHGRSGSWSPATVTIAIVARPVSASFVSGHPTCKGLGPVPQGPGGVVQERPGERKHHSRNSKVLGGWRWRVTHALMGKVHDKGLKRSAVHGGGNDAGSRPQKSPPRLEGD